MYALLLLKFFGCVLAVFESTQAREAMSLSQNGLAPRSAGKVLSTDWLSQNWKLVTFGAQGTTVSHTYIIDSPDNLITLDAVDLYCPGDRFKIIATPVEGGSPIAFYTSHAVFNKCVVSTSEPDHAFNSNIWSKGSIDLPAGTWKITIYVQASPYDGGIMAIRFNAK